MIIPTQFSLLFTLIAVLLLVGFIYGGFKDGFITKILDLATTIICIVIAWLLAEQWKGSIPLFPKDYNVLSDTPIGDIIYQSVNRILLFIVLFIILRLLALFLKPIFRSVNWLPLVGSINKFLGAILGAIQGILLVFLMCFILSTPLFINGEKILQKSGLYVVKDIYRNVLFVFDDTFDSIESIQRMITPLNELKDSDIPNITSWLEQQGFNELEQQEILELIKHRNGK